MLLDVVTSAIACTGVDMGTLSFRHKQGDPPFRCISTSLVRETVTFDRPPPSGLSYLFLLSWMADWSLVARNVTCVL